MAFDVINNSFTRAHDEIVRSGVAVGVPAAAKDEERGMAEVGGAAAGANSAAGVLALAQKLHDEYVSEGQNTRERLISEGQSRHEEVVGEATAWHEELLSAGQAKHDEFVSVGEARHDVLIAEADGLLAEATAQHAHMITEARERSAGMIAQAQQTRAEVFQALSHDRGLLQKEIDELGTLQRNQRAHLKSYLEGQLIQLEQTGATESG